METGNVTEIKYTNEYVKDGMDLCNKCKGPTGYSTSTSVEFRRHYVGDGGGQLCPACWVKIYGPCGCGKCRDVVLGIK